MKTLFSSLETLEARIAPAAVFVDATSLKVTFAGGVLKIAPLTVGADTEIHFAQTPAGDLLVSDDAGDDDLEVSADFNGTLRSINVTTGAGDDTIDFAFLTQGGLRAALSVTTGAGFDQVHFLEGQLVGAVSATGTEQLEVALGGPNSPVQIKGVVSVKSLHGSFLLAAEAQTGPLTVRGVDDFALYGGVTGLTTLTALDSATFQFGSSTGATPAHFGGTVRLTGSPGADSVVLGHATVAGAFTAMLGAGDNSFAAGEGSVITGALMIDAKGGNDDVTLGLANKPGPSLLGRVAIRLGEAVTQNALTVNSGLLAAALSYTGGKAADLVSIGAAAQLFGSLDVAASDGVNIVRIDSLSSLSRLNVTSGAGQDELAIGATGNGMVTARVTLGAGDDTLRLLASPTDLFLRLTADGSTGTNILIVPAYVPNSNFMLTRFTG